MSRGPLWTSGTGTILSNRCLAKLKRASASPSCSTTHMSPFGTTAMLCGEVSTGSPKRPDFTFSVFGSKIANSPAFCSVM